MAAVVAKQSPFEGGTVTDKSLSGLVVRALILNVRGIGFDSH